MGIGFALNESWRWDFVPHIGIGAAQAQCHCPAGGILPVNQYHRLVTDVCDGFHPKFGTSRDICTGRPFCSMAFSEHSFDATNGAFEVNYRQFNLSLAIGAGYVLLPTNTGGDGLPVLVLIS